MWSVYIGSTTVHAGVLVLSSWDSYSHQSKWYLHMNRDCLVTWSLELHPKANDNQCICSYLGGSYAIVIDCILCWTGKDLLWHSNQQPGSFNWGLCLVVQLSSRKGALLKTRARLGWTLCDHEMAEWYRVWNTETGGWFKVLHVDRLAPWNDDHNVDCEQVETSKFEESIVLHRQWPQPF